ncbi:hypothetical protein J3E64_000301 [Sphingobium sp. OAS761]|uniref:hypothetical protein n=1 Tax=Sphingobium sp. OAS761 TaxID=2817901 RepID=UPI0020A08F3B|nr:hypothetical protein [Sphingobium sp. OAS761]MCP1468634.1 hypothetical protein [Sphingobium sp. OAS761]
MHIIGIGNGRKKRGARRPVIFAALWMLIALTLLSALVPIGPPLSRPRGSAFNPATSEVVVQARRVERARAKNAVQPDSRRLPPVVLLSCLAAMLPGWIALATPGLFRPVVRARVVRLALATVRRARAPPTLS